MALVNLRDILENAKKEKYAVAAFDVSNDDMALAVIAAAEEKKAPVILMGLTADLMGDHLEYWMGNIKKMAQRALVPVCIHLDHATDIEMIKKCIDAGFTSVMFDGSMLPTALNIEKTKEVVSYARQFQVTVEAELGHVGDGIVGNSESGALKQDTCGQPEDFLTNPDEMESFILSTEVDCLAVAVGTAHGIYVHEPKIDFDRLKRLNAISTVPLVMHGGSGTPDDQIRKSIENGICKLNIFSELLCAFYGTMREELNEAEHLAIWPCKANRGPIAAMKEVIKAKLVLTGSAGKAQ